MTKGEALAELRHIAEKGVGGLGYGSRDKADEHIRADEILLELLDDDEIQAAYDDIDKSYR